jgi:hypothetical protein
MAEQIARQTPDEFLDRWKLRRYAEGKLLSEGMIIG